MVWSRLRWWKLNFDVGRYTMHFTDCDWHLERSLCASGLKSATLIAKGHHSEPGQMSTSMMQTLESTVELTTMPGPLSRVSIFFPTFLQHYMISRKVI